MFQLLLAILTGIVIRGALAINFPYEAIKLTEDDIDKFPALNFAVANSEPAEGPKCKSLPGSPDWPIEAEWSQFNDSLEGALLKPSLQASSCYPGPTFDSAKCNFVISPPGNTRFFLDDAATTLTQWPAGDTCVASRDPQGDCTQGGFPTYVVNVTTVKHVQAGVNFARNKNVRLVIK